MHNYNSTKSARNQEIIAAVSLFVSVCIACTARNLSTTPRHVDRQHQQLACAAIPGANNLDSQPRSVDLSASTKTVSSGKLTDSAGELKTTMFNSPDVFVDKPNFDQLTVSDT